MAYGIVVIITLLTSHEKETMVSAGSDLPSDWAVER